MSARAALEMEANLMILMKLLIFYDYLMTNLVFECGKCLPPDNFQCSYSLLKSDEL